MYIEEILLPETVVSEWTSTSCETRGSYFLLIFLVGSPPSRNTLRFPHSSLMNTIRSKSFNFLYQHHLVLPSLSQVFLKDYALQLKCGFFCK